MSLLGKLFQWCLAFLSRRPTRSGNFRPFCCAVPSASRHVSRQDLTEALRRQIRQARWLPLAEVVPRAGNWLAAWPSFWAAETSLPQALRYQGPSSETSCLTGPNSEQLEKGNCYRISALPPKKITGSFGFFFVLVFFLVLIHKALIEKVSCETKLICAVGRWWLLLVRGNEDGTGGFGELVWSPVSTRMLVMWVCCLWKVFKQCS